MLDWAQPLDRPVLVLLSKADKLSKRERSAALEQARAAFAARHLAGEVRLFSSVTRESVDEVRALLADWVDTWDAGHTNKKTPGKGE